MLGFQALFLMYRKIIYDTRIFVFVFLLRLLYNLYVSGEKMKSDGKYSIESLIDISFELYKLDNKDANKNEFKDSFLNDKKNKIYLESKKDRKLKIKICTYQLALYKEVEKMYELGKIDLNSANEFKRLINSYSNIDNKVNMKLSYLIFALKIVLLYVICLASFGLFSYRLNIVNSISEVFIASAIITVLYYITLIINNLTYISYERLIPKLIIILGLMIGNIYYHMYEYSYIWLFAFFFIDIVFQVSNKLLNRLLQKRRQNEQSND